VRSSRHNVTSSAPEGGRGLGLAAATPSIKGVGNQDGVVLVNSREAPINVVIKAKRKMLNRLDQKVRGQVRRLRTPPAQPTHHRRRGAT